MFDHGGENLEEGICKWLDTKGIHKTWDDVKVEKVDYFGLTKELNEPLIESEVKKLLSLLKEIINNNELKIIHKDLDNMVNLFDTSRLEGFYLRDEDELERVNTISKIKLLEVVFEPKYLVSNIQGLDTFEEKLTGWLTYLLRIVNACVELSDYFLSQDVTIGKTIGLRLIRTATHVIGTIIRHHMESVKYEQHDELKMLHDANFLPFHNWDRSIEAKTELKLFPKTKNDIIRAVLYAKKQGKRIKVAGMRHTWNHVFIDDPKIRSNGDVV